MDLGRIGRSDHAQRSYMGAKAFPGNGSRNRLASEEMSGKKTLDQMTEQERRNFEEMSPKERQAFEAELEEERWAEQPPLLIALEKAKESPRDDMEDVGGENGEEVSNWHRRRVPTAGGGHAVWEGDGTEQERPMSWVDECMVLMNDLRALAELNLLFWGDNEAKTEEERLLSYLSEMRQRVSVRMTELEVKLQMVHDEWPKNGNTVELNQMKVQLEQLERREERQRKLFMEEAKIKDRLVRELANKCETLQARGQMAKSSHNDKELDELRLRNMALTNELERLKSEHQEMMRLNLEWQRGGRGTTAEAIPWRTEAGPRRQEETSQERWQRPERSRMARGQDSEGERREESRWNSRVREAWLRNASMPPMSAYDGKSPFNEFVRRFLVRYEGSGMTNAQLTVLFEELLSGYPRSVFLSLPTYLKNGSNFDEMVEMMEERMQPDMLMRKLELVRELKKLERRKEQTVASFSLILEQNTERLYGKMARREKEELQALFFIDGVQLGDGYLRLLQRLEETGENQSKYEEVKKEALRLELMSSMKRSEEKREVAMRRPQEYGLAGTLNCSNCGGTGHSWRVCTSRGEDPSWRNTENGPGAVRPQGRPPDGGRGGGVEERRHRVCRVEKIQLRTSSCSNCGGTGHSWRVCTSRGENPSRRNSGNRPRAVRPQGRPKAGGEVGGAVERRHGVCRVDREREEDTVLECPLIGPTWKATVRINGIAVTALLDSGGAASVIPSDMMERLQIVKMEAIPNDYRLGDASGNSMNIEGVVKARVEMPGGPVGEVPFHVQKSKDGTVLLGTNAQKLWKEWYVEKERKDGLDTVVEYSPLKEEMVVAQVKVTTEDMSAEKQILMRKSAEETELGPRGSVHKKEGDDAKVKLMGKRWKTWVFPEGTPRGDNRSRKRNGHASGAPDNQQSNKESKKDDGGRR